MAQLQIETNPMGEIKLVKYDSDQGTVLMTGTEEECISALKEYILRRKKTALLVYIEDTETIVDRHTNDHVHISSDIFISK